MEDCNQNSQLIFFLETNDIETESMSKTEELLSEFGILFKSAEYQIRNAIVWLLDSVSENIQIAASNIFLCILHIYYSSLLNSQTQVTEHDYFIELSAVRLSILTQIKTRKVREVLKVLETTKLIEIGKHSVGNQTTIRVPILALRRLNIADIECQQNIEDNLKELEASRERSMEILRNNRSKGMIPFDMINDNISDTELMKSIVPDEEQRNMVYVVSYYYNKYTGKLFPWNIGNFNAILYNWRNRSDRKKSELGMSYAIYEAVHEKFDKVPLGKRIQTNYTPDISFSMYRDRETLSNLCYDDIFGQFTEFKDWLNSYKRNMATKDCPC